MSQEALGQASTAIPGRDRSARERTIRLWAGVVLFVFVATHLLNHAVGIFGVDAMSVVQGWRVALWRSWIGTTVLYGAAALHMVLALKRIVERRTWRMPLREAVQIALGLAIPVLIYEHIIGTRVLAQFHGVDDSYLATLRQLWPSLAWSQITLLAVTWLHGTIGLHYMWRSMSWYPRWREVLLVVAVLVPVLAVAGFISAGREALEFDTAAGRWTPDQVAAFTAAVRQTNLGLLVAAVALCVTIVGLEVYRRVGGRVMVRYTGHGEVAMARGLTLLEASRVNSIPHPSMCGGRGRCSTCRVLILSGLDTLDPPNAVEKAMLKRISAPPRVRLACQIRPTQDLSVQILLPPTAGERQLDWDEEALKWGSERNATVLFVDLRAFTRLTETQLPYDLVILLNRFLEEMRQAIEAHGGRVTTYQTDGLMAVFGLASSGRGMGSRSAIAAARDMLRAMETLNREFAAALPLPLRIGIGIHTGPIVLARVGDEERGYMVSVLGETVNIASQLEEATKERLADCLVSRETLVAANWAVPEKAQREIHLAFRAAPVIAFPLAIAEEAAAAAV